MRWTLSVVLPALAATTVLGYPVASGPSPPLGDIGFGLVSRGLGKRGQCKLGTALGQELRASIGAKDCPQNTGFEFNTNKAKITGKTNLATDAIAVRVNTKPTNKPTCDHIMEINILASVLEEEGGACDVMAAQNLSAEEEKAKIRELRSIINDPAENLVFFTAVAESLKTALVQSFQNGKPPAVDTQKPIHFLAMMDYLAKTKTQSTGTAAKLDAKIQTLFPGAQGSVTAKWAEFLVYAEANEALTKAFAQKKIQTEKDKVAKQAAETKNRKDKCGSGDGSAPPPAAPPAAPAPPTTRRLRMLRRYARPGVSANLNALQRRAVTPRAGPRAPPAPACPIPNAPRKRVVPASKAVPKPPPETNRRVAATRPAPKPRPKKVVPRPATRPRRAVGKAAPPRTRVTPTKKPKVVPKPQAKAKGKVRPRSRGRR